MDKYNPYIVAIATGFIVYILGSQKQNMQDSKSKEKKQTNINYVFMASVLTFIVANMYNGNSSDEPTMKVPF